LEHLLGAAAIKRFTYRGLPFMAVPHREDSTKLLRNLGYNIPGPIQYYYDWNGGSPFDSQRVTADLLSTNDRAYVLSEMGVGKTRAALYAYDYLRGIGAAHRVLIVAPLSTLVGVWDTEIFENFSHLSTGILYGDRKKRLRVLAEPHDCYIINHDGVEVLHRDLFARIDIDSIIVDELAIYRNARSVRWKNLRPLVARANWACGLTGAPTPNAPTDAYGQIKLITPERVGYSFKSFKDSTMRQLSQFTWIPRAEANDIVVAAMQPSVRFTRDECFDLPPTTYSTRQLQLTPDVARIYKKMFDELAIQVKQKVVTAANEGVKLSKLLQLSCGFVYDEDGKGHYIGGVDRFKAVIEVIESTDKHVIVFGAFRYMVSLMGQVLAKKYDVGIIHGETPKGERDRIFTGFQKGTSPRIIVAHPQTMAHGLTLTKADTIIWAAPITSLEIYEQANARITRSGQQNHTHIVHVQASPAEKYVYDRLRRKAKMQGALLEMFKESTP
jgi:SNF2 family DNA or RNA helicase